MYNQYETNTERSASVVSSQSTHSTNTQASHSFNQQQFIQPVMPLMQFCTGNTNGTNRNSAILTHNNGLIFLNNSTVNSHFGGFLNANNNFCFNC